MHLRPGDLIFTIFYPDLALVARPKGCKKRCCKLKIPLTTTPALLAGDSIVYLLTARTMWAVSRTELTETRHPRLLIGQDLDHSYLIGWHYVSARARAGSISIILGFMIARTALNLRAKVWYVGFLSRGQWWWRRRRRRAEGRARAAECEGHILIASNYCQTRQEKIQVWQLDLSGQ